MEHANPSVAISVIRIRLTPSSSVHLHSINYILFYGQSRQRFRGL